MRWLIIVIVHVCAIVSPFVSWQSDTRTTKSSFQDWPEEFEGIQLIGLEMTDKERGFSQDFPGKIARFTDGSREIIIRFVEQPSRKLHPSADCLRGSGYRVESQPISRGRNGHLWGCVLAHRNGNTYKICERIYDQSGNSWYDVSSWFWTALLNRSQGPWWAITVAEHRKRGQRKRGQI